MVEGFGNVRSCILPTRRISRVEVLIRRRWALWAPRSLLFTLKSFHRVEVNVAVPLRTNCLLIGGQGGWAGSPFSGCVTRCGGRGWVEVRFSKMHVGAGVQLGPSLAANFVGWTAEAARPAVAVARCLRSSKRASKVGSDYSTRDSPQLLYMTQISGEIA